jgi:hypothetical protein
VRRTLRQSNFPVQFRFMSIYMEKQIEKKPENLYEYLQMIGSRLSMYIDSKSLKDLSIHIQGYEAAEWVNGSKEASSEFIKFHDFVAKEYGLSSSSEGWPQIILKHCMKNEDAAAIEFYRLLDKFYQKAE